MTAIDYLKSSQNNNFFLLAGPCVIEGENMAMNIAAQIFEITKKLDIPYVFKGSYRKANRSRLDSFTGIGDLKALEILKKIRETFHIPVTTDIHTPAEAELAAAYVDILQIPAFLCRQTDLLIAAAKTGKLVNIKKGPFMSPEAIKFAVEKIRNAGNNMVAITDRGVSFGYDDIIVDFRGIPVMQENNCPVILDVTRSLQQSALTSADNEAYKLIETIARAGIAAGVDGIYIETHPDPANARSNVANMMHLDKLSDLLERLTLIRHTINKF